MTRTHLLIATLLVGSPPTVGLAQPVETQADILFQRAKGLMKEAKYAEACAAFEASQRLDPNTNTVVNLANCREKNNQLASAAELFHQAERELRALTDPENVKLRELVKSRASSLVPRLSKLTIRVSPTSRIPELEIIRDNDRIDQGLWNQPLPIDGGSYKLSARAPAYREWTTTVTIKTEGDDQVVEVPVLGTSQAEPTIPLSPVVAPTVIDQPSTGNPPTESDQPGPGRSLALPIGLGAGALAFGAAALGFELWGRGKYDAAKTEPDYERAGDLWAQANTRRHVAQAFGIASIACAGVATYFLVRTPPAHTLPGVTVLPVAGETLAGLQLDGRW